MNGNQLPFLDSIKISYVDNKQAELDLFQQGKLDFVWGLSAEAVKTFVPQVINDFWRLYKGDGGETDGGCAQAGGTVALLGLLGVAFGLGRARRRDRQEKE